MTSAPTPRTSDGRDIARQVVVISSAVFMVIAAFVGSGAAGGTPIQEALGGALDADASYLAPARPAFSIWSVIYGGLILYAIWQALPIQRAARRQRLLGWWIALTAVLNGLWILVVQFGTLLMSVLTILALLAVLAFVWRRTVLTRDPDDGVLDSVLIDGVTGLHFGWVTIATVANITAQLTQIADEPWADAAGFWGVLVLLVALAIGTAISVWSKGRVTPALAIAWGVLWIGVGRIADEPRQTAIGMTAVIVAVLLVALPVAITLARRARGVARPCRSPDPLTSGYSDPPAAVSESADAHGSPRVLPMGERAVLVEVGSLEAVLELHAALAASAPAGVVDLVPAARTVLVHLDPAVLSRSTARAWVLRTAADAADAGGPAAPPTEVTIDIVYDGADLADTARLLGLSAEALAQRHEAAEWTVAFAGFAPGFAYLVSPEWRFDVPRLDAPRTRVPSGAVGLAGQFTGAYPRPSPGGWRLIGTTRAPLFDAGAEPPALLTPGARVRFAAGQRGAYPIATGSSADLPEREPEPEPAPGGGLRIFEPGLLATIQDLGRPGRASQGIAPSGALDRGALRTANRLVGNKEGAAGIEVTLGGFRAVAERPGWIAVTGAWGDIRIDGHRVDPYVAHSWPAGAELLIDWFEHGVRAYLAVRGGLDGPVVAGSRSTDVLSRLGPRALRAGQRLGVRAESGGPVPPADVAPWSAPPHDEVVIEIGRGPRADWFAAPVVDSLYEFSWAVTEKADRVGMRLAGPALERAAAGELPSEGMVPGAIQVPPSGQPTVLLADGPVTGGYPVIAVVADASLDAFAQLRPGTRIRFRHAHGSSVEWR